MLGSSAGAMRTSCHPSIVFWTRGFERRQRACVGQTDLDDVHGERVEEFVCDEHGEAVVPVGDLVEGVVPRERDGTVFVCGAEGRALEGAHGGARLDEMHAVEFVAYGWELADDLGGYG